MEEGEEKELIRGDRGGASDLERGGGVRSSEKAG